jgi:TonB family protein
MNTQFPRFLLASSVLLSTLWATQSTAASDPISACGTHLISSPTPYPDDSARARRGGKVLLALTVAPSGKVAEATVSTSSGSRSLDAAALSGALAHWRFAPSNCGDFVAKQVAVEFEPRMFSTFSAARAPAYRRKLLTAAARGCEVSENGARESVIACIEDRTIATARLAER